MESRFDKTDKIEIICDEETQIVLTRDGVGNETIRTLQVSDVVDIIFEQRSMIAELRTDLEALENAMVLLEKRVTTLEPKL